MQVSPHVASLFITASYQGSLRRSIILFAIMMKGVAWTSVCRVWTSKTSYVLVIWHILIVEFQIHITI
jgi:hypothetical protein